VQVSSIEFPIDSALLFCDITSLWDWCRGGTLLCNMPAFHTSHKPRGKSKMV